MSTFFTGEVVREETFSFTPVGAELPFHILSGRLRELLLATAMDRVIDLTFPEQTLDEIIALHGLEAPRMKSLTYAEAREPVIVGMMPDGTNILIDGGHRRWFWAKRRKNKIRGWAVPYEIWMDFLFDPNGPMTIAHHASGEMLPQRNKHNA